MDMYYIGFDIGGTKCAVSLGKYENHNLEILARQETFTRESPYDTLEILAPFVYEWIERYNVRYAGVSCGGPLDSKKGVIISTPNLSKSWHGFAIVLYLNERFNLNSKLENDANASAVAEWKFGAGRNAANMIFMTFGTGLGAGLILNGKLYSGTNGNAGEIGHIRLENDGPLGYDKVGSVEGFCSGAGILRLAKIRAKEQAKTIEDNITTKLIFKKARQGDEFCLSIIHETAEKFARVISALVDMFNPEVIIAGGVFMRNYDLFMPIMLPIIKKECLTEAYSVCKILPAQIGENIGDYAALSIAVKED